MWAYRRVLGALITPLLAVTLSGCSGQDRRPGTVTLLVASRQFAFVQEMTLGFAHGVETIGGVEHTESGPGTADNIAELKELDALESDSPAGLSIFTLSPELFADSLGSAADRRVPTIAVHSPPAPGSGVTLFIGNDNHRLGAMLAEAVALQLPPDTGGVIVLGSPAPGVPSLDRRVAGVRETLNRLLPGAIVVGPFDTKQEPEANLRAWQIMRQANPGALAFIGIDGRDSSSLASLRAFSDDRWVAAAIGTDNHALAVAKTGRMVLVSAETYLQGQVAGQLLALSAKTGRPLPVGWIQTPGLLIQQSNAAKVVARQFSERRRKEWFDDMAYSIIRSPEQYLRPLDDAV